MFSEGTSQTRQRGQESGTVRGFVGLGLKGTQGMVWGGVLCVCLHKMVDIGRVCICQEAVNHALTINTFYCCKLQPSEAICVF